MQDNKMFTDGVFPAPNAPDNIKNTKEYGLAVAKGIYSINKEYINNRNARFANNRLYYKGRQPVTPYLDTMNIDGKQSFINIQFEPRPIAKKFVKVIVDGYMNQTEKPKVTAINPEIKERKSDIIDNAKWRVTEGQFIQAAEQGTGKRLEDHDAYTPESEEEIDFFYGLNNKQKEEFLLQMMISFTLKDNDYDYVKRQLLKNLSVYAVAATEDYVDNNGRVRFEVIPSEEIVYAASKQENFKDSPYFGRMRSMTIQDFRAIPGNKMTEEEIYTLAKSYQNKNNNGAWAFSDWNEGYVTAYSRPYDSYRISVLRFWYKAIKNINYVDGKDKWGRSVFDITPNLKETTNPDKRAGSKPIFVGYDGYWVVDTDTVIAWGLSKNQLKRDDSLEEVRSPFNVYMIDNDGSMDTKSAVEDIISSIIEMDLDILKIQQIKSQQSPNGFIIDIDGLDDINLGLGLGALSPLKLREIRTQTGDLYYRSKSESGDVNQQPPIKEHKADFGNILSELVADYNFELNNIRDYLGINEYRDGSGVNPKTGLGVIQNQIKNSNTATAHIYDALLNILKGLVTNIGLRIWDELGKPDVNKGYLYVLGKENTDFIKERAAVRSSLYDMDIELDMSDEDKKNFEEELQISLGKGLITVNDIIAIRSMPNLKYGAQYLSVVMAKREKQAAKAAEQNAQMNAQLQQQSLVQKAQLDLQASQLSLKEKVALEEAKTQRDLNVKKVDFYNQIRLSAFEKGMPVPEDIQREIDDYYMEQEEMKAAAVKQVMDEQDAQEQQSQQEQQTA